MSDNGTEQLYGPYVTGDGSVETLSVDVLSGDTFSVGLPVVEGKHSSATSGGS